MTRAFLLASIAVLSLATASDAEPVKRCRHPAISPDAKLIAFTYRGDIWTVPAQGGQATRLTVHNARDNSPIFSPDGKTIAFASDRYGSVDIFTIPVTGGTPKRLTFNSSYEWPRAYTPDGKWILMRSGMYGGTDVYKMPAEGGQPIRITGDDWEPEYYMCVAPDMKTAAIDLLGGPGGWRRRGYEWSGNADIWLVEWGTPIRWVKQLTTYKGNDFGPMLTPDGKAIYYVSDDGGAPNVWRMDTDGGNKKQVTRHEGDGVRNMMLSANGEKMVYEYESQIWIADAKSGEAHAVPIEAPTDLRDNILREQTFDSASEYELSPDGKKVALVVRGDVYVIAAEDGGPAKRLTTTPWREGHITWDGDSYHIYFITDRDGNKDLWKVSLKGEETQLTDTPEDENCPVLTPDKKWISYFFADREIRRMPVGGGDPETVIEGPFLYAQIAGGPTFSWAPDNTWIAYVIGNERYQSNIWIENTETGDKHQITNITRSMGRPEWAPDMKHVTFHSNTYDDNDIFVLDFLPKEIEFAEDDLDKLIAEAEKKTENDKEKEPEKKEVEKPQEPAKDGEEKKDETPPDGEKKNGDKEKKDEVKAPKLEIDYDGLEDRLRQVVGWDTWESNPIYTKDGKQLLFVSSRDGQVWKVGEDGKDATQLTSGGSGKGGLMLSPDGKRCWFISGGRPGSVDINNKNTKVLSFQAVMDINLVEENRQIFNEVWWMLSRTFYDPEHHGQNWDAIREKYSALIDWAPQKADFYDLMTEMIEELDASHLGIGGPADYRAPSADDTAYLGIEPDWVELETTGRWKVARVLPKSPAADKHSKIEVGEYILSVDGVELGPGVLYDDLMDHKVGKKVQLKVNAEPTMEGAREVAIKPINRQAIGDLFYDGWVESRRRITDELSGGRIGYLHIRGMSGQYLEQFKRELVTKVGGKDAMIVDVRYNGGGRIAHELLTILQKKPFVYMRARGYVPISEMDLLGDLWNKPSACLINQYSASNSEMFAEGYHALGIGPVVGIPTPGAVIATSSWGLMDGGSMRTPNWGVYTLSGEDLEGIGRQPDYYVPYDPNTFNRDDQDPTVAKAVEALMKQLAQQKPADVEMHTWPGRGGR